VIPAWQIIQRSAFEIRDHRHARARLHGTVFYRNEDQSHFPSSRVPGLLDPVWPLCVACPLAGYFGHE
jgi:hypothetical protein